MVISGFEKLTLLDYPGKTACLVFTQGCNFRCPFCHNKDLLCNGCDSKFKEEEIFDYLEKRKGLIDGVCITGGEPLLQKDIEKFILKIKQMGFLVKLDTNGSNPDKLSRLINIVDYIAMDIKNDFLDYGKTSGVEKINIDNIKRSIKIIEESDVEHEFRTTVVKQFHSLDKLMDICNYLGPNARYYIQNYKDCDTVLSKGLTGFDNKELEDYKEKLNVLYPNVVIRGM